MVPRGTLLAVLMVLGVTIPAIAATQVSDAQAEMEYGDAWAELGNFKRAVVHYKKAVQQDRGLTEARLSLANALFRLGNKQGALTELGRMHKLKPKSAAVACALGVVQLDVGRPQAACTSFDHALLCDPNHARSLFGTGQCHQAIYDRSRSEDQKNKAIDAFRTYRKSFPQGAHAIAAKEALDKLNYGEVGQKLAQAKEAFAKGKFRVAENLLREVVSERADLPEAHYLLGMALATPVINKMDEASQAWTRAGKTTPALLQRGILAYEDEDLEEAADLLTEAIEIDANNAQAYFYLALVSRDLLENDKAREALNQVIRLAPGTPLAERASSKLQVMTGQLSYLREGETIDTASEIELGSKLTRQIEEQFGLVVDQKLQKRLNSILRKIARHADRPPSTVPYRIKILDIDGLNALSFVGGTIYLYKGLVDFVRKQMHDSDDAFAAIIGHEVVHVVRRHGLGMLDLIGGSHGLVEGHSFDVRSLNKLMVGMSRIHEYEADHIGCLYAYRAGYDPAAAYRFHRLLIARGKEVPVGMDHPTHAERSDRLKEYLLSLRTKARHFDTGLRSLDNGDFDSAIMHFEIFLGVFPASWSARNNLGVAMHRLAMATQAQKRDFKLSTDLDPRSHVKPIRLRAVKATGASIDEALMIEAAEVFRMVSDQNPDYLPARHNFGSCLLALGKKTEAHKIFAAVLAKTPGSPQARSNLAVIHLMDRDFEKGVKLLQEIVRTEPEFSDAYYNLALAYQKSGRKEEARKTWLTYLTKDKQSGWAKSARKHLAELEK